MGHGGEHVAQPLLVGEEDSPRQEELLSSIFGSVTGQQGPEELTTTAATTAPSGLPFKTCPATDTATTASMAAVSAPPAAPAAARLSVEPPEPLEWGGHIAGAEFKPSQLSRLCREIGASQEQMDACADGDDPKAEYMALLRPSRLHRRCVALGTYSEAALDACADAEAPQLEYLRLLLQQS